MAALLFLIFAAAGGWAAFASARIGNRLIGISAVVVLLLAPVALIAFGLLRRELSFASSFLPALFYAVVPLVVYSLLVILAFIAGRRSRHA